MKRTALLALVASAVLCASVALAAGPSTTVTTRHTSLGTVLVTSSGRTLYLFEADARNRSTCSGPCATTWPPLLTHGKPRAAGGVNGHLLGEIRSGSSQQVTYNGHPLYTYSGDTKDGDLNSQNLKLFGAKWFVVSVQGAAIRKSS